MKAIIGKLAYPAAGVGAFAVALVVILALTGRLGAVLGRVPGIGGQTTAPEPDQPKPVPTVSTLRFFSSEELASMLKEARELKQKAQGEVNRLADEERRLGMLRQELQKERDELVRMQNELDTQRGELKKKELSLGERLIVIDQAEAAGLRRSALIYEAMEGKKAAPAIGALDRPQAAKVLSFMDEKKAARVLQELQPEVAAELMSLLRQLKLDQEARK